MSKFRPPDDKRGRARGQIHQWIKIKTIVASIYTEKLCRRCGLRMREYDAASYKGGTIIRLLAPDDEIWRLAKGPGRCPMKVIR